MLFPRILSAALSLIAATAVASAQITQIPPFTGQAFEGFETQPANQFDPCIVGRVFQNRADLCTPACVCSTIAPNWSGQCLVVPHTGNFLATALAGPLEFTFDQPVTRIGGYFATQIGVPAVLINLYGPCNANLGSFQPALASNCAWTWCGFQAGVLPIERMTVETATGLGSHVQIDSFQADFVAAFPQPQTYCTAKLNSLGCLPSMSFAGRSSFCCGSGFTIAATQVRNNKPGLLIYGSSGPASTPFLGGTLCVQPQIRRTIGVNSNGTPAPANDCSGVYTIDMNSFALGLLGGNPAAFLFIPGTVVNAQWWGRDPGFPFPNNATLSNALVFTIGWGC
ncbi:MAG TPA: hypothetical protein VK843_08620 [Planctomycetota bacterium]|nr:hypothetical protein [Planctomycetota bacterium]